MITMNLFITNSYRLLRYANPIMQISYKAFIVSLSGKITTHGH